MTQTATVDRTAPAPLPRKPWNRHLLAVAVLAVLMVPVPLLLPQAQQAVAVRVLIFALMSIGWNVMSGFGVSRGQSDALVDGHKSSVVITS